jgi:hypothetical protein
LDVSPQAYFAESVSNMMIYIVYEITQGKHILVILLCKEKITIIYLWKQIESAPLVQSHIF